MSGRKRKLADVAVLLICVAAPSGLVFGQAATEPTTEDSFTPQITKPPEEPKKLEALAKSIEAEIAALQPTTQPASTQPAEQARAAAANELLELLKGYVAELRELQATGAKIEELKSDQTVTELSKQIEEAELKRGEYERLAQQRRAYPTDEEIEKADKLYREAEQAQDARTTLQRSRTERLAGLPKQIEETNEAVTATRQALEKYLTDAKARFETAENQAAKQEIVQRKRALEWEHNRKLLRATLLPLTETRLKLEQQHDDQRIKTFGPLVQAVREYRNALEKWRSQSEVEWLESWLGDENLKSYEQRYLEARLEIAKGLQFFEGYDSRTRSRFTKTRLEDLRGRDLRRRAYWENFAQSLGRREGRRILAAYHGLQKESDEQASELDKLRDALDESIDEQQAVLEERQRIDESLARHEEWFRQVLTLPAAKQAGSQAPPLKEAERAKARKRFNELTAEYRPKLTKKVSDIVQEQDALVKRLKEAIAMGEERLELMLKGERELYWAHLRVRDRGPIPRNWSQVKGEWEPFSGQPEALRASLLSRDLRSMQGTTLLQRACALLFVGAMVGLAVGMRRRLRTWMASVERRRREDGTFAKEAPALPLAVRAQFQAAQLLVRTALTAFPLAALLLALAALSLGGMAMPLATGGVAFVLSMRVLFASVSVLFEPGNPHLRVVQCTDGVGGYHRRWLRVLVYSQVVGLPLPMILRLAPDALSHTRLLLWEWDKTIGLVLLLVYLLLRRRMFIGTVASGADGARRAGSLLALIYPAFPLAALVLTGLELAGYGALTDYLLTGMLVTVALILVARVLRDLVADAAEYIAEQLTQMPEESERAEAQAEPDGSDPPEPSATSPPAGAIEVPLHQAATEQAESPRPRVATAEHPLVDASVPIVRMAIAVAALVGILRAWGISLVEINNWMSFSPWSVGDQAVTLWRIVGAGAVIALSVIVSRSLRAFLEAKVFPVAAQLDRGAQAAVRALLHYSLIFLGLYVALQLLHLNLGALTVALGTFGLGLGLGLQPLFVNFISGLIMLAERHVKVGDVVEVNGVLGEVLAVTMRSTLIRTYDNVDMVIPNAEFITSGVINWTLRDTKIRGKVKVGVAYGSDVRLVRRLLLDIARRSPLVLADPPPVVWFTDFGDNSLDFVLVSWFANTSDRWKFLTEVRMEIDGAFREHKIDIPFPQRTLSVKDDAPIPVRMIEGDGKRG